jgi:hypothetical protein
MKASIDTSQADERMRKMIAQLSDKELLRAGHNAVNRAVLAANTAMSREIRATVNLKASTIRDTTRIAKSKGTTVGATLTVKMVGIPLAEYGGKFGVKGLTIRVLKSSGRSRIENAFAVATSRHPARAFVRETDTRYPLQMLFGPSVRSQAEKALPAASLRASEVLENRLRYEIEKAVERGAR